MKFLKFVRLWTSQVSRQVRIGFGLPVLGLFTFMKLFSGHSSITIFFFFFLNYRGLFVSAIEQYGVEIERT